MEKIVEMDIQVDDEIKRSMLTDQQRKEVYYILNEITSHGRRLIKAHQQMAPFYDGLSGRNCACIYLTAQGFSEPEVLNIYYAPGEVDSSVKKDIIKHIAYFIYHAGFNNRDEMAKYYNELILPIIQKGVEEMGI